MTLEQTQRRRQAVETIHDVVSAMRAIAAGRIQHAQKALAAARRYAAVVHRAVAAIEDEQTQLDWPAADGRETLIVLTSEQPLCGSFNHDVLDLAEGAGMNCDSKARSGWSSSAIAADGNWRLAAFAPTMQKRRRIP